MRPLLTSRGTALSGLAAMALLAVMMLRGTLDIVQAAERTVVVLAVVVLVDRIALPVARALVGTPLPPEEPGGPARNG